MGLNFLNLIGGCEMVKRWVVLLLILTGAFALWACTPQPPKEKAGEGEVTAAEPEPGAKDMYAIAKQGWVLFKDPSLAGSTNDMSCHSCHPYGGKDHSPEAMAKGTLFGKAGTYPKVVEMTKDAYGDREITLIEMINFCIANPLAAEPLADDDPQMEALVFFHNGLAPKTYENEALPVINLKCSGCHTGDNPTTGVTLDDKDKAVSSVEKIRALVDEGKMPKKGEVTDMEYLTLIIWATTEINKE
jgi:hypothetical protein